MKCNTFLKVGFMALLIGGLVACDSPETSGNNYKVDSDGTEGQPVEEQLTAEETTQRLNSMAQQIVSTFNTKDQKEAVAFAEPLVYDLVEYEYDWSGFEDYYEDGRFDAIWSMPRYALDVASGKRLATQVSDFTFSFKNESVTFEADDKNRTWICKGPNKDNSIQFIYTVKGKKCIAKAWGEGEIRTYTTNVSWRDWDYYYDEDGNWVETYEDINKTYTAEVPERIIFTLSDETTEYIRITVQIDLKKNDYAYFNVEGKVINMTWKATTNVQSTHAEVAVSYNYGSTNLFAVEGNVPSYVAIEKKDNQTWEEWIELYGDRYEELLAKSGGASAKVYLLDQAQIVSKVESANAFYTAYNAWYDKYPWDSNKDWAEQEKRQRKAQLELADIYNDNIYVGIFYNSDIEQAQVKVDVFKDTDEYGRWDPSTGEYEPVDYYELAPVLYFPADGTSYEFGEYFTENKFSNVLNITEDLINQYLDLLRYFDIDPIELR